MSVLVIIPTYTECDNLPATERSDAELDPAFRT